MDHKHLGRQEQAGGEGRMTLVARTALCRFLHPQSPSLLPRFDRLVALDAGAAGTEGSAAGRH